MRWSAVGAPPLATPVSKHAVQLGGIRGLELAPVLLADHARHLFPELLDPASTAAGALPVSQEARHQPRSLKHSRSTTFF